jgi:stage V sporulation protein SpoVS
MGTRYYQCRVTADTNPTKLATSIKISLKNYDGVELISIGAQSLNVATKALIMANSFYHKENNKPLFFYPSFKLVLDFENKEKHAIVWTLSKE